MKPAAGLLVSQTHCANSLSFCSAQQCKQALSTKALTASQPESPSLRPGQSTTLSVKPAAVLLVRRGLGNRRCPKPSGMLVFSLTSALTRAVLPALSLPA